MLGEFGLGRGLGAFFLKDAFFVLEADAVEPSHQNFLAAIDEVGGQNLFRHGARGDPGQNPSQGGRTLVQGLAQQILGAAFGGDGGGLDGLSEQARALLGQGGEEGGGVLRGHGGKDFVGTHAG